MALTQAVLAGALVVAYLALCWACLRPRLQPRLPRLAIAAPTAPDLLVAFASQGGRAEALARSHLPVVREAGQVAVLPLDRVGDALLARTRRVLFVVSTYGEGEPPDNGLRFARRWVTEPRRSGALAHLDFAVLALGDSGYRRFCGFGLALEQGLCAHGAAPLFPAVTVDSAQGAPDTSAWWRQLQRLGLANGVPAAGAAPAGPCFHDWRLLERECLNADSPGAPVHHLRLALPDSAARGSGAAQPPWQAGDIAVIRPFNDPDRPLREYSIASLPEDGTLDLLVRQVTRDDGSPGLGSSWLVDEARPGTPLTLAIRRNPGFHGPDPARPLILVGNGTGMAGLRAHLRERARDHRADNWLLFGERSSRADLHFGAELRDWLHSGHLTRLDCAFSRDQAQRRYVQDLLRESALDLRAWLARGAALYVCGSLAGMAPAVHGVLVELLGSAGLESLIAEGRYRRDVY